MEDEKNVATPAEEVEVSETVESEAPAEEIVAEGESPEERYEQEAEKQPETVPLHVHKETRDKLKTEIRELREQLSKAQSPSRAKLSEIASKWGVEPETISELAEAIKSESAREVESKFGSLVEEQKRAKVEEAFNNEFSKLAKNFPQLEGKRDVIKNLAFTKQYLKTPLDRIAQDVFGDLLGKGGMEEARPSADRGGEVIDFSKPMTPEQKSQVLKDPEARAKYYAYLDQNTLR